jgi:hypothetical protein
LLVCVLDWLTLSFLGLLPLCCFIRFAIRFFVPQFFLSGDDKQNRKQRQKNNEIDMPNCGLSSTNLLLFRIFLVQGSSGLIIVSSFYSSFFSGDDKQNWKRRQKKQLKRLC